jgi:hypothetical protein
MTGLRLVKYSWDPTKIPYTFSAPIFSAWATDPAAFWTRPVPCFLGQTAAQAQIVGCYIQSKRDDA